MRCEKCGEVRWSIRPRVQPDEPECPACGATMVPERRRPGRRPALRRVERRDVGALPPRVTVS
jgi:hypothetical protein